MINEEIDIPSKYRQDAMAVIEFYLEQGRLRIRQLFEQNPYPHLIVQCNRESKVVRENTRSQSRNTNIKYYSSYTIINTQNKV